MKILQVCPVFYPMYPASGSAKVAYDISRMLSSRGKKVVLFTTDRAICESCLSREIKNYDGIDVFLAHRILPSIFDKQRIYITSCNFVSIIKQHIETSDVIHIHEYRTLQNIIIHHFAIKYGVPYILQAHGSLSLSMAKKKLKRIYDVLFGYRLVRDASKVIALNRMEAYQYRRMGVPEE
ncbi:MAG: glycosyltransferase, partial [Candidatus Hodarchaeales archaeon]